MVSTLKKRQSNKRHLSQLDEIEQVVIIGNAMSKRLGNTTVNEDTANQEFTVGNSDGGLAVNEYVVSVKSLERCFKEKIERKMIKIVDTVKIKIQNAI